MELIFQLSIDLRNGKSIRMSFPNGPSRDATFTVLREAMGKPEPIVFSFNPDIPHGMPIMGATATFRSDAIVMLECLDIQK